MSNPPPVRAVLARAVLARTPPSIRDRLVAMPSIRREYLLSFDPVISFHQPTFSVQRGVLFEGIRDAFTSGSDQTIQDTEEQPFTLTLDTVPGACPTPVVIRGPDQIRLPYFAALSCDAGTRRAVLLLAVEELRLDRTAEDRWRDVFADHRLSDDEMTLFYDECMDAPIAVVDIVRKAVTASNTISSEAVPKSSDYFEAMVGAYDGSTTIDGYASRAGEAVMQDWMTWSQRDGPPYCLLLASHPSLTARLSAHFQSTRSNDQLWTWIEHTGDRLSQIGTIEIAFRLLRIQPNIEPRLISILERVLADESTEDFGDLKIYQSLYIFVDAELSRSKMFATKPPFYRRLATSAHATLLLRMLQSGGSGSVRWEGDVFSKAARRFYLQSLVDLRVESRWAPEQHTVELIKNRLLCRVVGAAEEHREHIRTDQLRMLVAGLTARVTEVAALRGQKTSPFEGAIEGAEELPKELQKLLASYSEADALSEEHVNALLLASRWFGMHVAYADAAAAVLAKSDYSLARIKDLDGRVAVISALASVAAGSRSHALGDAVAILLRLYRRSVPDVFSCAETMMVGLVAAASRSERAEWLTLVGGLLTELALGDLTLDEAHELHSDLYELCNIEPDLWRTCGRAEAALSAIPSRVGAMTESG